MCVWGGGSVAHLQGGGGLCPLIGGRGEEGGWGGVGWGLTSQGGDQPPHANTHTNIPTHHLQVVTCRRTPGPKRDVGGRHLQQYDVIKRNLSEYGAYGEAVATFENGPLSICSKTWNLCGIAVGCLKQHKLTYRQRSHKPRQGQQAKQTNTCR